MNLGITNLMNSYSLGGLYPWNSLAYTGGLYPLNTSYMNGFGVDFSTLLNKAYNTQGKSFCIEFDEKGQVSKITEMNTDKQIASSTEKEVQEVRERKISYAEQQKYHRHRLGGCSWEYRML